MPPSGFVTVEASTLASVARSLITRFEAEVESGVHASRDAGIVHELWTILHHMGGASDVERGVLSFAEGLYLALKAGRTLEEILSELRTLENKQYV